MKALIKVGYACNENCTFCHTADVRHIDDTAARIEWKIDRAKRLGYSMVVLSGGEPTIRPELLGWARQIASRGMDLGLVTNGLMLSYPHVTDELIEACRLRYVYMSLHGGDAKTHRSVVRAHSFDKAIAAVRALHGRVPDLTVNCVVTTANLEHLRGVVDALIDLPGLCIKFSMTQPKGAANRLFDLIVPTIERCADRVADAIAYGAQKASAEGPRFAHDGLPFCLLPGLEDLYDDLKTHRFATMIEVDEDDFIPVDDVAKVHPARCRPCALRGACPGLYRGYHEVHGDGALTPRLGVARSNSFTFVPERDLAQPPGAPCPIRGDGVTPYDHGRTLLLRMKDRLRLYRTETRDFADDELLDVKRRTGQLYVDVSTKLAPDDFAKDLRKLVPARECGACPEQSRCTRAYEPTKVDVFTRDDERLIALLDALEGRVLDLGCGEGPYLERLAARVRAGRLRYVGVDPDEARLRVLASRHAFVIGGAAGGAALDEAGTFIAARAEDLGTDLGSFDHVLALRSYNHLADPEVAIASAARRLRVGGSLILVDNVAFGLVRGRAHATRAERALGGVFEHYRNDDADDAARRHESELLRLVERWDVGPTTSNQWMLRFERQPRQIEET